MTKNQIKEQLYRLCVVPGEYDFRRDGYQADSIRRPNNTVLRNFEEDLRRQGVDNFNQEMFGALFAEITHDLHRKADAPERSVVDPTHLDAGTELLLDLGAGQELEVLYIDVNANAWLIMRTVAVEALIPGNIYTTTNQQLRVGNRVAFTDDQGREVSVGPLLNILPPRVLAPKLQQDVPPVAFADGIAYLEGDFTGRLDLNELSVAPSAQSQYKLTIDTTSLTGTIEPLENNVTPHQTKLIREWTEKEDYSDRTHTFVVHTPGKITFTDGKWAIQDIPVIDWIVKSGT